MQKSALVLEGGGMRGLFTVGVLDVLIEKGIYLDGCFGVSAGAVHGSCYVSGQQGRNRDVILGYINDPRYFGFRNLLKEGNLFGTQFAYYEIPYRLVPFDFETFDRSPVHFLAGVTDCETGNCVFLDRWEYREEILEVLRASCSLPFVSRPVNIRGRRYLDGGISDPVPVREAEERGYQKLVVILSQAAGYRKKPFRHPGIARAFYRRFPEVARALENRHRVYNRTMEYLEEKEEKGEFFVIRSDSTASVSRLEKDTAKLDRLYRQGYRKAEEITGQLQEFLKK